MLFYMMLSNTPMNSSSPKVYSSESTSGFSLQREQKDCFNPILTALSICAGEFFVKYGFVPVFPDYLT